MDKRDEEQQEEEDQIQEEERQQQDNSVIGSLNDYHRSFNNLREGKNTARNSKAAIRNAARIARGATRAAQVGVRAVGILARLGPVGWTVILIIFLMLVILLFSGGGSPLPFGGGSGSGGGTNNGGNFVSSGGLDYYIPFRDSSILPPDIKDTIAKNWPNARLENFDIIVSEARAHGWNPSFLLTLWIEESGGQGVAQYDDPLGCAPDPNNPNSDIRIALGCVFRAYDSYPNDKFADFMCNYDQGANAPCVFNNQFFPKTIKSVYSTLVTTGPGALVLITPTPADLASASCPIPGVPVTCGSRDNPRGNPLCGHCNADTAYSSDMQNCTYEGINFAEDIGGTAGQDVILPTINNESLFWNFFAQNPSSIGVTIKYKAVNSKNQTFVIQFHHTEPGSWINNGNSGTVGSRICSTCNHVHVEFYEQKTTGFSQYYDASKTFCI